MTPRFPACARELLEVERVAATVAVDRRDRSRFEIAQQHSRLNLAELAERDPADRWHRKCGRQPAGRLARPEGEREQHRRTGTAPQQCPDQLDRCGVAPVQVVEHEHERTLDRQQREQRADRPMAAVTLIGHRLPRLTPEGRSDGRISPSSRTTSSGPRSSACDATCASSASVQTLKGRSRSNSAATPWSTRHPRSCARCRSSRRRLVLPIPGSPSTVTHPDAPPASTPNIASSSASSASRPTIGLARASVITLRRA